MHIFGLIDRKGRLSLIDRKGRLSLIDRKGRLSLHSWGVGRKIIKFIIPTIYNKPTRCNSGSIVFKQLQVCSTCFGRPLRPSSGAL